MFDNKLKSIFKFGLFTIISLLVQLLGMITNLIIARNVSVSDFGTYTVILTVIGLVSTLAFSWSSSVVSFYGSKEISKEGNMRKTIKSRNIILAISFSITGIAFLLFSRQINEYIGYEYSILIFIWVLIKAINEYITYYFIAREKKIISSSVSLIGRLSSVVLLLVLEYNLTELLLISIFCEVLTFITIKFIDKNDFKETKLNKEYFTEILSFSLWQLSGTVSIFVINSASILVINHFYSKEEVGLFNAAFKIFAGIFMLANVITSYYVASLTRHFQNEDKKSVKKFFINIRFTLITIVALGHILLFIFAEYIFLRLYTVDYTSSIPVFQVLLLASLCRFWTVFHMLYFNINKMYKFQQILNIFNALLNISLCIILVPKMGIVGGAIAITSSTLLIAIISSLICEPKIYNYLKK
ncbi:lipopolysaccharide biosynthesis protein [Peribacillus simplex]|uniref:lipopolysaccharide biosynthesis protein n=1 Tax=Peribacillus simplex TaxID=1478 RepID=UPI0033398BC5